MQETLGQKMLLALAVLLTLFFIPFGIAFAIADFL